MVYQNNELKWCRKCPECDCEIAYKRKFTADHAFTHKTLCSKCKLTGHKFTESRNKKMAEVQRLNWANKKSNVLVNKLFDGAVYFNDEGWWCRTCPECNIIVLHSRKDNAMESYVNKRGCRKCAKIGTKSPTYIHGEYSVKRKARPIIIPDEVTGVYFNKHIKLWCRICPCCSKETSYNARYACILAQRKNTQCITCAYDRYTSIGESKFLDYVQVYDRQISVNELVVDGLNESTKTVYEFLGDYWHGNPSEFDPQAINKVRHMTFGELYKATFERFDLLKSFGYTINYIWESDWLKFEHGKVSDPNIVSL